MSWHRRGLAALAAALAVLTGVSATLPDGPATLDVVTARAELAGGTVLTAADLELRTVVAADAPAGALSDAAPLVGRMLAAPAAAGQMLTALALVSAPASARPGHVVAPVRLADPGLAGLLHPGDLVDVVGAGSSTGSRASVIARSARVVTVPVPDEASSAQSSGALVLVEVPADTATALAQAAAGGQLTVSWR